MGMYISPPKDTDERETPDELFVQLLLEFDFNLDVCATQENTKCPRYYTKHDNALNKRWDGICWMNPPYSQCGTWVRKALEESRKGSTVVCLVPSATDTKWWHEVVLFAEVRFIKGRIKFSGQKNSAPFPSAILIFRPPKR